MSPAPDPAMKPLTQPVQTSPSFLARLLQGFEWAFQNKPATDFFGPGQPLPSSGPVEGSGRQRDYDMLENVQVAPRQELQEQLLWLADNWDLVRMAIETRKDQLTKIPWSIRKKSKVEGKSKGDIDEDLVKFFRFPDGTHSYSQWARMIWEDMLVMDAPAVFVRRNAGGQVVGLEPIDGSTITPKITPWGRTPTTGTAYTQQIKGLPAFRYGVQDLVYFPRNPRNRHAFGMGPVEQIVITINIGLRRQNYQLDYYIHGSMPDMIIEAPESWSLDQIKKFRTWFSETFGGNNKERRAGAVVPHGANVHDSKEKALKDEYDEWLARVVCYAFSLPPTPFVKQMNRGTANTAQQAALMEGLEPFKIWWRDFIEQCLLRMGRDDVELAYEQELPIDPLQRAQVFQLALGGTTGWLNRNEVRMLEGRDPEKDPVLPVAGGPPPEAGAPALDGKVPSAAKPADAQRQDAKPVVKLAKAVRKDHMARIEQGGKVALGVSKRLHDLSRVLVPAMVKAYGEVGKADDDQPKKVVNAAVNQDDLQDLVDYVGDRNLETYGAGVKDAAAELQEKANDAMVHLANEKAKDWAAAHAGDLIKNFADATKEDLEKTVRQALAEGWSNDKLADELHESWSFSSKRAEVIARTETAFADVQGNAALYREAGCEKGQVLLGENPCPECEDAAKEPIPLDGDLAPFHPLCECDIAPILPEEA